MQDEQGNALTLDANGEGTFKNYLKDRLIESANQANAENPIQLDWVKFGADGTQLDWQGYIHSEPRMKSPPAFDALDLSLGENELFGSESIKSRHFTTFSQQ